MSLLDLNQIIKVHESRIPDYLNDVLEPHEQFAFFADPVAARESIKQWLQSKEYEIIDGEKYYLLSAPVHRVDFEIIEVKKEPSDYMRK